MNLLITRELILKFLKFGIVGASGVIVDFACTYLWKEIFKIQKYGNMEILKYGNMKNMEVWKYCNMKNMET